MAAEEVPASATRPHNEVIQCNATERAVLIAGHCCNALLQTMLDTHSYALLHGHAGYSFVAQV